MASLIFALSLGFLYVWLRRRDKRMLRNGVVLVAAAWFAVAGALQLLSEVFPPVQWLWLGVLALLPFAVIVLAIFLIANGLTMLRAEGRRLGNLLSLLLGVSILGLPVLALVLVATQQPAAIGVAALLFFLCSYFGVVFVIFLAYALAYGRMKHDFHPAAIVILGSQLINGQVPPLLRSRLDRALSIYRAAPEPRPLLIPSGGQGADESRAEGDGMAEYLLDAGVPPADVRPEVRSRTTTENLRLSREIQLGAGRPGPLIAVTNNFHALRAALLTRKLDIDAQVVGSRTARYYIPSAFLREFVAIISEHKIMHAVLCLPFLGMSALMVMGAIAAQ